MRRISTLVAAAMILLAAVAPAASANDGNGWYRWSHDAIKVEFGRFGGTAVYCAMYIAQRESGHWPFSDNGNHHGIFQLSDSKWPAVQAAARELGRKPNWYDPRQNARVAMWLFEGSRVGPGGSFRQHWAQTVPGWCP